jgi:pseudaminic acid synthase
MNMRNFVNINGVRIGPDYKPFIIAELSANHNGDIDRAFLIMEEAKKAGADAIKLQTYTPDTITMDHDSDDFKIKDGLWAGKTLYDLYKGAYMPWEWHKPLFEKAKSLGITIFSSPFDFSAVDLLEQLDAPAYKIASFELVDLPLIARVAETGKPMIMSTGMANEAEIEDAINTARNSGCDELIILHCVSGYPAPSDQYNLRTINDISRQFNVIAGLSDHTIDNATAIASVALGACLIEKHVTMSRNDGGADDSFSIEPIELAQLCKDTKTAWHALGKVNYEQTESEKENAKFRRSLYVVEDIKKGETLTNENIKSIRPGYGLNPNLYYDVIGAKALKDISRGTPLSFELYDK